MSWIDDLLNNSLIVYLVLAILVFHIYLKKTNQTIPEVVEKIRLIFQDKEETK